MSRSKSMPDEIALAVGGTAIEAALTPSLRARLLSGGVRR